MNNKFKGKKFTDEELTRVSMAPKEAWIQHLMSYRFQDIVFVHLEIWLMDYVSMTAYKIDHMEFFQLYYSLTTLSGGGRRGDSTYLCSKDRSKVIFDDYISKIREKALDIVPFTSYSIELTRDVQPEFYHIASNISFTS